MTVQRPDLGRVWGSNGNLFDPGPAKYTQGWTAEIPTYEVLNYLQNRTDTALLATAERGVPEWGTDVTYEKGSVVWDNTNNIIYIALIDAPSRDNPPSANSAQWEPSVYQLSTSAHTDLVNNVNTHVADKSNPHSTTAEQVGTYTKPVIDGKLNQVTTELNTHAGKRDNPHGVTATQAGGVPATGGTYTGPVTFASGEVKINPAAGDFGVGVSGTEVRLRNKTFTLSLDDQGVARANNVKLLNEVQYVEKRKSIEHEFAVPTPDFEIDALSDIHIKHGVGFSELIRSSSASYTDKSGVVQTAAAGMPRHTATGLILEGAKAEQLTADADGNLKGMTKGTIYLEVFVPATETLLSVIFDTAPTRQYIEVWPATNQVRVLASSGLSGYGLVKGQINRIAATFEGTTIKLYVNNVLTTATATFNFSNTTLLRSGYTAYGTHHLRRLSIWQQVLTAEQISTL